jgi:tripartite-type tricarboxylate transporter receptor subunit TctC
LIDLLGGHVDVMMSSLPLAHFKTGKLRPLAVTGIRRSIVEPDLPTIAEAALPGFEVSAWYGLIAPRDTPPAVIARIRADVVKVLAMEAVRGNFAKLGVEVIGNTPDEFALQIKRELARWGKVVKDSGIPLL